MNARNDLESLTFAPRASHLAASCTPGARLTQASKQAWRYSVGPSLCGVIRCGGAKRSTNKNDR